MIFLTLKLKASSSIIHHIITNFLIDVEYFADLDKYSCHHTHVCVQEEDAGTLESLSDQLGLAELWETLSNCLRELADTPDHHAGV